jgi:hypothetical protein
MTDKVFFLAQSDRYGYLVWDEEILQEMRTLEIYGGIHGNN